MSRASPLERLRHLERKLGDDGMYVDQNTVGIAIEIIEYADRRAISRAAYPNSSIEDRKMRDLIDGVAK